MLYESTSDLKVNANKELASVVDLNNVDKCESQLCLSNKVEKKVAKKLIIVILVCCTFMLLEIIGGIFANSLAIITDGFHLLTDLAGFIISLLSSYLAQKQATKSMNFGFRRIEILGAFLSVLFIWLLAGALSFLAITRILNNDYEIEVNIMILMALLGVFLNGSMAFILSYSNTKCKETETMRKNSILIAPKIIDSKINFANKFDQEDGRNKKKRNELISDCEKVNQMVSRNINIRAAFIHIIGDMIQSMGVLIAALIIYFKPQLKFADPMCTIVFSVIVLATTIPILIDIVYVLTESFPKKLDYNELEASLKSVEGVLKVNDLRAWYLSTETYALNARLTVDSKLINCNLVENLLMECRNVLAVMADFEHVNLELEFGRKNSEVLNAEFRDFNLRRYSSQ